MDSTKKKILLISTAAVSIVFISAAIFYKTASSHFDSSDKYNYLKQGHSISEKKRFDESMDYAKKYNARIKAMDNLSTPGKGSKVPDTSEVAKAEKSNSDISLYFLFSSGVLNTDQYIDAENKLNSGIRNLSTIEGNQNISEYFNENKDSLKKIYGINTSGDLQKIKSKYSKLGNSINVTVDNNFSKTDDGKISFNISFNNGSTKQTIVLSYESDIAMTVNWSL